jgi:two-component system, NtrC family, sensor kinase
LDIDPTHAQPIGSYLVAINEQEMSQTLGQLIWMGGAVGGVIVVSLGILAFPLANRLTQPIRRLTHFAELVGQDQVIPFPVELQHRNDEIGVLAQTLNAMLLRLDETLAIAHVSEQELRRQTVELQATLTTLQKTQTHLIQSEKMSGLGQLVAGVAHEINNPVNFIYGNLRYANEYTEQLMQIIQLYQQYSRTDHPAIQTAIEGCDFDFIATDLPNLFQSMKGGADRIKQIVQSLRVFSRLDESESKVVNLHDGLDSTLVLLTHRLRLNSDRSEIMICQNYGELPRVECYAGEMNQVFINILSNAIDAINERVIQKGTLENPCIEIQTRSLDNDLIQITIHDNGIGMTDEVRSQIFNPFFTTKPVGSGIGMGLANTYQIIVEHHRGDITVCSALGEGTSFTITLPIRLQK